MKSKAHFLIDDCIWLFRDITRDKPASLFDNKFLKVLKNAYEKYGVKTQLNAFYRNSSFYGNDDFSLSDMTDAYKKEWEEASNWLKIGFHAKEEFPDYPHVNAKYEDVKSLFNTIKNEVLRFAGEKTFTYGVCPHWNTVSYDGVRALYDCGVKIMDVSVGDAMEYNGDVNSLPYGHAMRLLNNRKPETRVYSRGGPDTAINNSVCAYNHLSDEQFEKTNDLTEGVFDEKTGMIFKKFHTPQMTLNLMDVGAAEKLISDYAKGKEYVGVCVHEQYFYSDYFAYQPDFEEKIYIMGKVLSEENYEFIFPEELVPLIYFNK